MGKIGFSKGVLFESELSFLPKAVLGVRSVFEYAGSVAQDSLRLLAVGF